MLKPWKTLQTQYAIHNPWIKVRCERVKLPDGRTIDDFYSLEGRPLVAILIIDAQNRVLLVRQYRQAVRKITIDLPGGEIKKRESITHAARREVLEETGYSPLKTK